MCEDLTPDVFKAIYAAIAPEQECVVRDISQVTDVYFWIAFLPYCRGCHYCEVSTKKDWDQTPLNRKVVLFDPSEEAKMKEVLDQETNKGSRCHPRLLNKNSGECIGERLGNHDHDIPLEDQATITLTGALPTRRKVQLPVCFELTEQSVIDRSDYFELEIECSGKTFRQAFVVDKHGEDTKFKLTPSSIENSRAGFPFRLSCAIGDVRPVAFRDRSAIDELILVLDRTCPSARYLNAASEFSYDPKAVIRKLKRSEVREPSTDKSVFEYEKAEASGVGVIQAEDLVKTSLQLNEDIREGILDGLFQAIAKQSLPQTTSVSVYGFSDDVAGLRVAEEHSNQIPHRLYADRLLLSKLETILGSNELGFAPGFDVCDDLDSTLHLVAERMRLTKTYPPILIVGNSPPHTGGLRGKKLRKIFDQPGWRSHQRKNSSTLESDLSFFSGKNVKIAYVFLDILSGQREQDVYREEREIQNLQKIVFEGLHELFDQVSSHPATQEGVSDGVIQAIEYFQSKSKLKFQFID